MSEEKYFVKPEVKTAIGRHINAAQIAEIVKAFAGAMPSVGEQNDPRIVVYAHQQATVQLMLDLFEVAVFPPVVPINS